MNTSYKEFLGLAVENQIVYGDETFIYPEWMIELLQKTTIGDALTRHYFEVKGNAEDVLLGRKDNMAGLQGGNHGDQFQSFVPYPFGEINEPPADDKDVKFQWKVGTIEVTGTYNRNQRQSLFLSTITKYPSLGEVLGLSKDVFGRNDLFCFVHALGLYSKQ